LGGYETVELVRISKTCEMDQDENVTRHTLHTGLWAEVSQHFNNLSP